MASTDAVRFEHQLDGVFNARRVERDRPPFVEADRHGLRRDGHVLAPERHAHDRLDDLHAAVELLEIFRFVRRAKNIRVGRVRLLDAHLVREAGALHVLGHLLAAAQLVDERLIEPWLVDAQARVREQAVSIEPLDVVALERAPVTPDVHVVFFHRDDEHGAGDGAADRRGVEVGDAGRRDVKSARLQRGDPFVDELPPAVDEPRPFGAVFERAARNVVVVLFVGLAEVGRVRVRNRALAAHPMEGCARVEAAGKRNADFLAGRNVLQDRRHLCCQ